MSKDKTSVEKLERQLAEIEDSVVEEDDPVSKALERALRSDENQTADLTLIPTKYIAEFAKSLGIEPGSDDALAKLKKTATRRDVDRFLATPVPPRTLGPGAALSFPKERIEEMAKARGFGMSAEDWKRGHES
jgi:hypothetical protein